MNLLVLPLLFGFCSCQVLLLTTDEYLWLQIWVSPVFNLLLLYMIVVYLRNKVLRIEHGQLVLSLLVIQWVSSLTYIINSLVQWNYQKEICFIDGLMWRIVSNYIGGKGGLIMKYYIKLFQEMYFTSTTQRSVSL